MNACRTCFARYDLSPLFDDSKVVKFSSDELFLVTGVQIAPNDGYPQSACKKCIKTITRVLHLRELSQKVDQMLKTISKQVPIKSKGIYTDFNTLQTDSDNDSNFGLNYDDSRLNNSSSTINYQHDKESNKFKVSHHFNKDSNSFTSFTKQQIDTKPVLKDKSEINIDNTRNPPMGSHNDSPLINIKVEVENNYLDDQSLSGSVLNDANEINNADFYEGLRQPATSNEDLKSPNAETKLDVPKQYPNEHMSNKQLGKEILPDEDKEFGKLCNVNIENYIPSKNLDELFKDAKCFQMDSSDMVHEPIRRRIRDLRGNNSIINGKPVINRDKRYINYCRQKQNELRKQNEIEKRKKNIIYGDIIEQYNGKNKKLMALAVTPYYARGPVQCKLCHKKLRNPANFKTHAKSHFEPEFTCEFQNCGKKFLTRNHMQYHQQRKHGELKRLACTQCPFRAVERNTLRNHVRAEHTGEKPYVCNECGAAFRMRNNIIQHMTKHFGVRNMQCEFCPALFTRRSQLWSHQHKVHFLTYTYHCYLCPETYKGALPVRRHLTSVHGVPQDQQLKIQRVVTKKDDAPNYSLPQLGLANDLCHT